MLVSGKMTQDTAAALLADGVAGFATGAATFDLSSVAELDSSGLAVLFGWQRAAQQQGKTLQLLNPPQNLVSLAEVYGVVNLLPLA